MRSRASSFNSQYPLLSLRSSSNFLRLFPCLLVTSICPFIFPSITCFKRHFLCKMLQIQLAFRFIISCVIFLCSLRAKNIPIKLPSCIKLAFHIISWRTICLYLSSLPQINLRLMAGSLVQTHRQSLNTFLKQSRSNFADVRMVKMRGIFFFELRFFPEINGF